MKTETAKDVVRLLNEKTSHVNLLSKLKERKIVLCAIIDGYNNDLQISDALIEKIVSIVTEDSKSEINRIDREIESL